jgi:hypothetical protein
MVKSLGFVFRRSASSISDIDEDIDEPPNSGAAEYRDNSARIDRGWVASKGLVCLIINQASAEQNTSSDFDVEIGFGTTNIGCLHA